METLSVFPKHNPTPSSTTFSADPEIPTPARDTPTVFAMESILTFPNDTPRFPI